MAEQAEGLRRPPSPPPASTTLARPATPKSGTTRCRLPMRFLPECDGLASLLTDHRHRLGAAPPFKVVSNFASGGHGSRRPRRQHARRVDRRTGPCLLIAAARRVIGGPSIRTIRTVEDLGTARPSRPGPRRPHARRRRHGPHRLRPGQGVAAAAGTCGTSCTTTCTAASRRRTEPGRPPGEAGRGRASRSCPSTPTSTTTHRPVQRGSASAK